MWNFSEILNKSRRVINVDTYILILYLLFSKIKQRNLTVFRRCLFALLKIRIL